MEVGGYAIYDLFGLKVHFSIGDILSVLEEKPLLLLDLISRIYEKSDLDEARTETARRLQQALKSLYRNDAEISSPAAAREWTQTGAEENRAFFRQFLEKNPEQGQDTVSLCHILFLLLSLTEHPLSPEEARNLNAFLSRRLDKNILRIQSDEQGTPWLYRGSRKITALEKPDESLSGLDLVTVSRDSDTGFLGIRQDGTVVNHSAAFLKPLPRKAAVKVALRQNGYAILFQGGTLIHNLHPDWHGERLPALAENFELNGDRLRVFPFE